MAIVASLSVFGWLAWRGADDGSISSLASAFYCALAAAAQPKRRSRRSAGQTTAAILFVTAMAWLLLSSLQPSARTPDLLWIELVRFAGYAACAIIGARIADEDAARQAFERWLMRGALCFVIAMIATSVIATDIRIATVLGHDARRMSGTMGNANVLACVGGVIMLFGLAIAGRNISSLHSLSQRDWIDLAISVAAALLALALCARTQSRFALAAALVLAGVFVASPLLRNRDTRRIAAITPIAALPILILLAPGTASRVDTLQHDAGSRLDYYTVLIRQIAAAPFFGSGPGSFPEINVHLQGAIDGRTWDWRAAHDIVLHAALEGGIPFALLLLSCATMVAWQIMRGFGRWRHDAYARSMVASLILVAACASVDIALNFPAVAMLFCLLTGYMWRRSLTAGPEK